MELLNTLYNLMSLVFVLGTICSMGLSLTMKQITGPLRSARFVIISLLANFVLPVILALILIQIFSLGESLAVVCCWSPWLPAHPRCPRRQFSPKLTQLQPPG